jgi:2-hydroxy-3-keto-5-methylthiopentenyl-1-phosphate phosphatase
MTQSQLIKNKIKEFNSKWDFWNEEAYNYDYESIEADKLQKKLIEQWLTSTLTSTIEETERQDMVRCAAMESNYMQRETVLKAKIEETRKTVIEEIGERVDKLQTHGGGVYYYIDEVKNSLTPKEESKVHEIVQISKEEEYHAEKCLCNCHCPGKECTFPLEPHVAICSHCKEEVVNNEDLVVKKLSSEVCNCDVCPGECDPDCSHCKERDI